MAIKDWMAYKLIQLIQSLTFFAMSSSNLMGIVAE